MQGNRFQPAYPSLHAATALLLFYRNSSFTFLHHQLSFISIVTALLLFYCTVFLTFLQHLIGTHCVAHAPSQTVIQSSAIGFFCASFQHIQQPIPVVLASSRSGGGRRGHVHFPNLQLPSSVSFPPTIVPAARHLQKRPQLAPTCPWCDDIRCHHDRQIGQQCEYQWRR